MGTLLSTKIGYYLNICWGSYKLLCIPYNRNTLRDLRVLHYLEKCISSDHFEFGYWVSAPLCLFRSFVNNCEHWHKFCPQ